MFKLNQRVNVPGKVGIQGHVGARREKQTMTIPAVSLLKWIGEDGTEQQATFSDADLTAANAPPVARIVEVKKASRKSKR
jgi:hypothetical protein